MQDPNASRDQTPPGAPSPARTRLGEILVQNGAITPTQLAHALAEQPKLKLPLGKILLSLNYLTEETMRQALGRQLNVPYLDLEKVIIDRSLGTLVDRAYARQHALLPVAQIGRTLTVAMDDPTSAAIIDELAARTGHAITVVTASSRSIQRGLGRLYGEGPASAAPTAPASAASAPAKPTPGGRAGTTAAKNPAGGASTTSTAAEAGSPARTDEWLRTLLQRAHDHRATDIYFDQVPAGTRVRFRIDGRVRPAASHGLDAGFEPHTRAVITRLKAQCALNPAERRQAQRGRCEFVLDTQAGPIVLDLQVAVLPTYHGESVRVRPVDRSRVPRAIPALDLPADVASRLQSMLEEGAGVLLVTGPAGSGRSATLHAAARHLHHLGRHLFTVEDPIAYADADLSQCQVDVQNGASVASALADCLQHEPDAVMIGDLNDAATAALAFRAGDAGRLVLAGLTARRASAVIPRLRDLGVETSLLASSLAGVLTQRLVPRPCNVCHSTTGCEECDYTGVHGRVPRAEFWTPDDHDRRLMLQSASFTDVRLSAERTTVGDLD